jgi:hypothetical protein
MDNVHHGDPPTLAALFFGELWRGRDNLRVSLRAPVRLMALPSVISPVASLGCMVLVFVGLAGWPWMGPWLSIAALTGLVAIAVAKATAVTVRGRHLSPLRWLQSVAVVATYEAARALSLVTPVSHRLRRRVA